MMAEVHFLAYIVLDEAALKQDPARPKYMLSGLYARSWSAIKFTRRKLGGWFAGFVVRKIVFDDDGNLISDEVVHEENKEKKA